MGNLGIPEGRLVISDGARVLGHCLTVLSVTKLMRCRGIGNSRAGDIATRPRELEQDYLNMLLIAPQVDASIAVG